MSRGNLLADRRGRYADASLARYDRAIAELRRQHPCLDGEGIIERESHGVALRDTGPK